MGQSNLELRNRAIPYQANVWGYNRNEDSDENITNDQLSYPGDLENFQSGSTLSTVNTIRILQPHFGDIINANLQISFTLASAEASRQLRIAIGTFGSNYAADTSYSDSYINASHLKITGLEEPFTIGAAGSFTKFTLNLTPAMYKRGHSEFLDDAFVLLLVFDQAPSTGSGWGFTKFQVDGTMQMGLL